MSWGRNASVERHSDETTNRSATASFAECRLFIFNTYKFRFGLEIAGDAYDQHHENHSVHYSMQAKVHQTVNRHPGDRNQRCKTCGTSKAAFSAQVDPSSSQNKDCEPNKKSQSDHAATRNQLQIVVVGLLRRH